MSEALWLAIGLMLLFEGIGPLLYPNRWANFMKNLAEEDPLVLRRIGGILCVVGAVIIYSFV